MNQKREVQRLLQSRSEHRVLFFITLEYFGWLYQPSSGLQISAEMARAFRVFAKQLHVSHILFVSFFFFFLVFAVSTEECVDYMQSVTMLYMRQLYRKACNTRRFTYFFFFAHLTWKGIFGGYTKRSITQTPNVYFSLIQGFHIAQSLTA